MDRENRTETGLWTGIVVAAVVVIATQVVMAAPARVPDDSQRLAKAKDHIAEEQWAQAVAELRLALADPKEPDRDEVLFWLAHGLDHQGDSAAALRSIGDLEDRFPRSRWVRPARSLRL